MESQQKHFCESMGIGTDNLHIGVAYIERDRERSMGIGTDNLHIGVAYIYIERERDQWVLGLTTFTLE